MGGGRTNWILFGLLWFSAVWIHQTPDNPNAASRLDLLHALVRQGTWCIDAYHTNTTDKAYWKGHYYSDKPPGLALLAWPSFTVLAGALGAHLDTADGWIASSWICHGLVVAPVTAAAGVACFAWLTRRTHARAALVTTVGLFLGSPWGAYATSWFPHAVTGAILIFALSRAESPNVRGLRVSWFVIGLFCAGAWGTEYSAGLAAAAVAGLAGRAGARALGAYALGWLPVLLLVGSYHACCFGTPLTIPYQHNLQLPHMQHGWCGIHFPPSPDPLLHLLLSPARGLFVWTPILLLLLPGWCVQYQQDRRGFYLSYVVLLAQSVLMAGYADVQAGATVGPRLILCVLPWLALPVAFAAGRSTKSAALLAAIGCLINGAATWAGIELPADSASPFTIPRRLAAGSSAYHLGQIMGWPVWLSGFVYGGAQMAGLAWLWLRTRPAWPEKALSP